jgi:hypothetical protein
MKHLIPVALLLVLVPGVALTAPAERAGRMDTLTGRGESL